LGHPGEASTSAAPAPSNETGNLKSQMAEADTLILGEPPSPPTSAWHPALVALGSGVSVFFLGTGAESLVISAVRGDRAALEWISDVLISIAVASVTYLWLHLKASRERLLDVERSSIVLAEQLRLAAAIQRNLLPAVPATTPGFTWASRMVPAGLVGGDFYDFLEPKEGVTLVLIGDISGKGIPAALLHSSLREVFRLIASQTADPVSIAERLAAALYDQTNGAPYSSAIVARFERDSRRLTYVNAGHPPGLLLRGDEEWNLGVGGPPLGILPAATYTEGKIDLRPGDLGVFVTDGITEALEGRPATVRDLLRSSPRFIHGDGSAAEACDLLLQAAAEAPGPIGAGEWHDDATAFVFRVT
jgi:serine phosphatase RsbU (regulator of sigma subunit)